MFVICFSVAKSQAREVMEAFERVPDKMHTLQFPCSIGKTQLAATIREKPCRMDYQTPGLLK
jgi:hypothetical protein